MPKVASIREQIKAIASSQGPSMVPQPREESKPQPQAPPDKPSERVPLLGELVKDAKVRLEIARLVAACGQLGETIRPLEKQKHKIVERLKVLAGDHKVGKAVVGDWRLNYYNVPRSTIDRDKLLELGVQPSVIAAATVTKDSYTLRVSHNKEDEDE